MSCNSILDSLQIELKKENISEEEREHIEDRMLDIVKKIGEKDTENKHFLAKIVTMEG